MKTTHLTLAFITIIVSISCKSSGNKHFDRKKFDASTIKSTSMEARHIPNDVYIMKDSVVIYRDTIR